MREYCTPGSVRGAPGNRCPYLDNVGCWTFGSCDDPMRREGFPDFANGWPSRPSRCAEDELLTELDT